MEKEIRIPFNKVKLILFLTGSILFMICGIYFLLYQPNFDNLISTKYTFLSKNLGSFIIGFLALIFFGFIVIALLKKIFVDKYSIIIRKNEIINNTIGFSEKRISFSDIKTTSIFIFGSNEFIMIYLTNPKEYIDRQKNVFDKILMKLNNRFYKTPIMINKHAVNYNFEEIHSLLQNEIKKYKRNND